MIPTLYLTRNGLLEPLGQSQVLAYLRGLSREYHITLITYEKEEDWRDAARMSAAREECERLGIRWLPQRFWPQPKIVAPALSMLRMVWLAWRAVREQRVRLIHARSYIPAAVGWVLSRLTGVPFIFDMRALWPEELITAGRLRRGSRLHRIIVAAERVCLRDAAAVVSLTHAAVDYLRHVYPTELAGQRVAVIPTCVDLDRFAMREGDAGFQPLHGCIGTLLSGWFKVDWLAAWWAYVAEQQPQARFEVITRDDPQAVRAALDPNRVLGERLSIRACAPAEMPAAIRKHEVSAMFYAGGQPSELGRSPTRMGEVLATGQPVVANAGVGDVASIVQTHRVGVLLEGTQPHHLQAAWQALCALMQEPDLPQRCRAAAEAVFSLRSGTAAYRALYQDILR
ncbi:Glycosyltransferase involved in cell wall bisynthesis [Fontimonas thermophila]|uniref:Glycosyltransferase involved in cell wall bisynthesis n=1 Tax=Fontimonas thermophila TaxID=1076937 RepID=A0A1I2IJU0_9GAMM|nr:glycosyltransferase [Fontimonas thermophila]SFF42652.1 Glycosyltransferase involved in cell wall bisynthesis [Fontimonas thermophila]